MLTILVGIKAKYCKNLYRFCGTDTPHPSPLPEREREFEDGAAFNELMLLAVVKA